MILILYYTFTIHSSWNVIFFKDMIILSSFQLFIKSPVWPNKDDLSSFSILFTTWTRPIFVVCVILHIYQSLFYISYNHKLLLATGLFSKMWCCHLLLVLTQILLLVGAPVDLVATQDMTMDCIYSKQENLSAHMTPANTKAVLSAKYLFWTFFFTGSLLFKFRFASISYLKNQTSKRSQWYQI